MKRLLVIFCSLALLIAAGAPAFADTGTGVPSAITTALSGPVTVGNYRYSFGSGDLTNLQNYWNSLDPIPTDDDVAAIAGEIRDIKGDIADDPSGYAGDLWLAIQTNNNFTDLRRILGNPIVGGPAYSGNKVTLALDGHPITLTRTDVSSNDGSSDNSDSSSTPTVSTPSSSQVSVTTGADGKQAVAVTAQTSAASVSNGAASLQATVPSDAVTAASSTQGASISVTVPTSAIVGQLNSAAVQNVSLTITAPSGIAYSNVEHTAVSLNVEAAVLEAAKQTQKDVTVGVVDALTGKQVYSWTFKGADLANSAAALTGVNLALNTATSTLIPAVASALPASAKGVVLTFGNSGTLPAPATVKVLIADQGFKPGETVYAYYFNAASGKMEQLNVASYTVDAGGYISLTVSHTSQYVVLPVQVPSVKSVSVDTGARLTVKAGKTYQFKITSSVKPTFVCGNGSVFKVAGSGSKGNDYFFKVTAVGKAGSCAGFYVNGEKSPRTIGSIA